MKSKKVDTRRNQILCFLANKKDPVTINEIYKWILKNSEYCERVCIANDIRLLQLEGKVKISYIDDMIKNQWTNNKKKQRRIYASLITSEE